MSERSNTSRSSGNRDYDERGGKKYNDRGKRKERREVSIQLLGRDTGATFVSLLVLAFLLFIIPKLFPILHIFWTSTSPSRGNQPFACNDVLPLPMFHHHRGEQKTGGGEYAGTDEG